MMTTSSRKPTRHDRYVVTKPPISGPIAAAIAADGADERVRLLHARRPRSCRGSATASPGSSSDAPSPPMIAQKMTTAVMLWASVIASAPIA